MKKEACCLALGIGLLSEISFASGQQPSQTIVAQVMEPTADVAKAYVAAVEGSHQGVILDPRPLEK
jgi:hypothetical protein